MEQTTFTSIPAVINREQRQILIDAEELRFLRRKMMGQLFAFSLAVVTGMGVLVLFLIVGYTLVSGIGGIDLAFFLEIPKPLGQEGGGIAQAILGSLEMLAVAALMAVPLGIATAIYLAEYGRGNNRFADTVRFALELLASLPSIVVGVFVWALIVRSFTGYSGVAGAVSLAVIMIPIIARSVEEILKLVPNSLREAALALGVPQWRVTMQVVIPAVLPGILTGVVLSVARAAGETAPLLLTALGNQFFNYDLTKPMAAMPLQIYNYAISPYQDWHEKAWAATLILIIVIGIFSGAVRFTMRKFNHVH